MSVVNELLQGGLYKRSQGRTARQVTFAAIGAVVCLGCWKLSGHWTGSGTFLQLGLPGLLMAAGLWIAYRLVNWPTFADFLISVEGEMAKVSWPSRSELIRSSIVVILTIFVLAAILFAYDFIWNWLLKALGVVSRGE